jgi:hypothetical protein
LSRQIRVQDYRNLKLLESEDLGYYEMNMNDTIPKKAMFLVPPLPLVQEAKDKKPKATDIIKVVLKQRAGSTTTAPTYKLKGTKFCEGTVVEWINFQKAISELW